MYQSTPQGAGVKGWEHSVESQHGRPLSSTGQSSSFLNLRFRFESGRGLHHWLLALLPHIWELGELNRMSATEPLDSETHEKYLDLILTKLDQILIEMQKIHGTLERLPREIGGEIRD